LDVASARAIGQANGKPHSPLNDDNLSWTRHHSSKFSLDVQLPLLGHDEYVSLKSSHQRRLAHAIKLRAYIVGAKGTVGH
jgi:hypothetical protein